MKTTAFKFLTLIALTIAFVSCKDKADEAKTKEAEATIKAEATSAKYLASPSESSIAWTGFKPTGKHNGTINIESGVFTINDEKLESGTFLIDMNSIVVSDIPAEEEGNAKLVGHLKNADFFDVEKYPTAAFEVTGLEEKDGKTWLSGNLTLKEKKNNVTFPVSLNSTEDTYSISSEVFTIDRSKWDITYKSKSFFENLGDKFINDDIELKISVVAKKS